MSNDYTLPPKTEGQPKMMTIAGDRMELEEGNYIDFGHWLSPEWCEAYGQAVAAPLLARIAELEAENQTLTQECSNAEDESGRLEEELQKAYDDSDRLRAELAAKDARIAELEAEGKRIARICDDRAGIIDGLREYLRDFEGDRDRLRAEVEALRADADTTVRVVWRAAITAANNVCVQRSDRLNSEDGPCERIGEASECAKAIRAWIEPDAFMDELRELVDAAIAARKGEGSEG